MTLCRHYAPHAARSAEGRLLERVGRQQVFGRSLQAVVLHARCLASLSHWAFWMRGSGGKCCRRPWLGGSCKSQSQSQSCRNGADLVEPLAAVECHGVAVRAAHLQWRCKVCEEKGACGECEGWCMHAAVWGETHHHLPHVPAGAKAVAVV
jgi:hypothetical protein